MRIHFPSMSEHWKDEARAERKAFESTIHPNMPEPREFHVCPRCDGVGNISETIPLHPDYFHYECPDCCGTGHLFGMLSMNSEGMN